MPLDEATRQLLVSLEPDVRRLTERTHARGERGEAVRYDSVSRMATWETKRGDVIGRWYGEVVARYLIRDRMLRWAWAGAPALAPATHAEAISQEGQSRGVPQLSRSVVGDLDEEEALSLARLGVLVAKGEGLECRRSENEITYVGLFDSPRPREPDPSRYSVPPPPVAEHGPRRGSSPPKRPETPSPTRSHRSTPPAPYRSLPPITEIYGPRTRKSSPPGAVTAPPLEAAPARPSAPRRIREPARALFVPIATAILTAVAKAYPRYQQALVVIGVHSEAAETPQKLVVMLAVVDATGVLRDLDPSHELMEAAARMVEADRADGNGPWRKLSARIVPKVDGGATLNVDVV